MDHAQYLPPRYHTRTGQISRLRQRLRPGGLSLRFANQKKPSSARLDLPGRGRGRLRHLPVPHGRAKDLRLHQAILQGGRDRHLHQPQSLRRASGAYASVCRGFGLLFFPALVRKPAQHGPPARSGERGFGGGAVCFLFVPAGHRAGRNHILSLPGRNPGLDVQRRLYGRLGAAHHKAEGMDAGGFCPPDLRRRLRDLDRARPCAGAF